VAGYYVTFPNKDKKAPTEPDIVGLPPPFISFPLAVVLLGCRFLNSKIMALGTKVVSLCEQTSRRGTRRLIEWLQKHRLMKSRMNCRLCKKKMKFQKTQTGDGYQW